MHPPRDDAKAIGTGFVPYLIPRSCEHLSFDCLASPPHYAGHRSLMDSSRLDVTIAESKSDRMSKPLSAIHHVPMWSLVPAKIAAPGT